MKRLTALILALIMVLSLCGCGGQQVELTADNLEDYLTIEVDVTSSNISHDSVNIAGVSIPNTNGSSEIVINTFTQANATFEDVNITLRVEPKYVQPWSEWAFIDNDEVEVEDDGDEQHYREFNISIPSNGETETTAELYLVDYLAAPNTKMNNLNTCTYKIVEVSGYAIK